MMILYSMPWVPTLDMHREILYEDIGARSMYLGHE